MNDEITRSAATNIDVWLLELDLPEDRINTLQAHLNPAEQQRAQNYQHVQMRQQFIAARAQLKILLGQYLNTSANSIEFDIGKHGKPRLKKTAPDQGLVFNLSHTGNSGLLAIARDCAIGIDIEQVNTQRNIVGMVQRCFSETEQEKWKQLNPAQQLEQFFEYWCAKEAFLKATGHGISLGMHLCEIDLGKQHLSKVPRDFEPAERWKLYPLNITQHSTNSMKACLVSNRKGQQIRLISSSLSQAKQTLPTDDSLSNR